MHVATIQGRSRPNLSPPPGCGRGLRAIRVEPDGREVMPGKVAVFGPHPMLSITIEALTADGGDDIHVHAGGQGVWVARMAAELGAEPMLCGFIGGETGDGAAAAARASCRSSCAWSRPARQRLPTCTTAAAASACRSRRAPRMPPSRHELDDLFSLTVRRGARRPTCW